MLHQTQLITEMVKGPKVAPALVSKHEVLSKQRGASFKRRGVYLNHHALTDIKTTWFRVALKSRPTDWFLRTIAVLSAGAHRS